MVARKDVALEIRDMLLQQMGINPKDVPYEEDPNSPHAGDPNWIDMSSYLNCQKKKK